MRYAGQSQRDVGQMLRAGSGSAISKQLAKYRQVFEEKKMAKLLGGIESQLESQRKRHQGKIAKS